MPFSRGSACRALRGFVKSVLYAVLALTHGVSINKSSIREREKGMAMAAIWGTDCRDHKLHKHIGVGERQRAVFQQRTHWNVRRSICHIIRHLQSRD